MRVNPEIVVVEGADDLVRVRRQHRVAVCLGPTDLPGAWAHVEALWECTEQERPSAPPREGANPREGEPKRGFVCEGELGVGLPHSSDEAGEGRAARVGGAKGGAGQGACWRER
jgi:hypothetical protein